jgi:PncC family amidohydrolase
MAEGVRRHLGTDVGLAITGIAGPDGGTPEKPVGTVVMAVAAGTTVARAYRLMGDRQTVRQHAVVLALELVRQTLTGAVNGDSRT